MAVGSGISAQFGIKAEVTYGTPVTPDRFLEFNSEGIEEQFQDMASVGLGSGGFKRTTHVVRKTIGAGGDIECDLFDRGMGLLFKHCLGTMTTTTVLGNERRHRATVDLATRMGGLSATVQVGKPSVDGTVRPFTFEGGKVTDWELATEWGGLVTLTTTWDFEDVKTATALAAPTYIAGRTPYVYADTSTLTIGGSAVFARSIKLTGTTALDIDRRGVTGPLKREPLANDLMAITGELDCEFESLTQYQALVANTVQALAWTLTGDTITGAGGEGPYKLVVSIPNLHFTGTPPTVGGPEIVRMTLPFEALYDGTVNPLTIDYHSDDTAA